MSERCPVNTLIGILSKRWVMFILMTLQQWKISFNDIKRANPGMSAKILSERLQELENEGFILRKVTGDRPVRIEYLLSPKGISLQEVMMKLNEWAIEHKTQILDNLPA